MKRLAAALALLALTGTLVFPSAAAPFALSQSDAITQDISLAPATTPNGDYAYLDGDDELVVDLSASNPNLAGDAEGVNPDGVTALANVFRIHYNGTRYAHVWITDESDAVTFTVDGDPIDSETNNVTLGPNRSVVVGVVVDTTGDGGGGLVDDMEVNAKVADPEDVNGASTDGGGSVASTGDGDADASEDDTDTASSDDGTAVQVFAPSPTERSVTVVNAPTEGQTTIGLDGMPVAGTAGEDGPAANLSLDSVAVAGEGGGALSLALTATAPAEPETVGVASLGAVEVTETEGTVSAATLRFSVSRAYLDANDIEPSELTVVRRSDGEPSTLLVRIIDGDAERVRFAADTPGFSTFTVAALRPSIGVAEASLSSESVAANESATVTARVVNDGRAAGSRTVTLTLDGEPVAERTVDLGANESTTVTFDVSPDGTGEYAVAVGGTTAGTLTVEGDVRTVSTPADVGTTPESGDAAPAVTEAPVEEPAGLGLVEVGGLALATALAASLFVLVRRVSR